LSQAVAGRAHQHFQVLDDFLQGHSIRDHHHRVFRGRQRSHGALRVALVAGLLISQHVIEFDVLAALAQFAQPPLGSRGCRRRQEDFALGLREGHGPLIAALGYQVTVACELALQINQMRANPWIAGNQVDAGRYLG
jgi:hypothetical protein